MNILVDFRPLTSRLVYRETERFILDKLITLSGASRGHNWYFLLDSPRDEKKWKIPANCQFLYKKALPGILGWKLWYRWQVPAIAGKIQADLLISTGGISTRVPIPQIVWVPDIQGNETNGFRQNYQQLLLQKRAQSLHQASLLYFLSDTIRGEWAALLPESEGKCRLVPPSASESGRPLMWTEKERMKTNHTGGRDYFAITGEEAETHIISLLKAFSQFKKWQQSNMHLVIVVKNIGSRVPFIEKLDNYKYRHEVVICDQEDESQLTDVLAAAYCILYVGCQADTGTFHLNAFKSEVPVITNQVSALTSIGGDAVLYADMGTPESVSSQMIKIYKDEKLRTQLIDKGKERWPSYPGIDIQEALSKELDRVLNKNKT